MKARSAASWAKKGREALEKLTRVLAFEFELQSQHLREILIAILGFILPLLLMPLAILESGPPAWQHVESFPGGSIVQRLMFISVGEQRVLYAVGSPGGLYATTNQGEHWVHPTKGLPDGMLGEIKILDLASDPRDPDVLYAIVESPSAVLRPMLYWTADGGLRWQPRASLGEQRVKALALAPASGDLYVVTSSRLLRAFALDADLTIQERFEAGFDHTRWLELASFASRTTATTLVIRPDWPSNIPPKSPTLQHGVGTLAVNIKLPISPTLRTALTLYVGTRAKGLQIVLHDGSNTSLLPAADDADTIFLREHATINAICLGPSERVYAATDQGVYASDDAGYSWRRIGLESENVLALCIDPIIGDTLYAGLAEGGVWHRRGLQTPWQPLGRGMRKVNVLTLALDHSAQVLYAGTDKGLWRFSLVAQ